MRRSIRRPAARAAESATSIRKAKFARNDAKHHPGRGATRSGAPPIRDRNKENGVYDGPGSAAHHSASLRAAPRPGHARELGEKSDGNAQESKVQAARAQIQSACKKARQQGGEIRGQEVCEEDGES